MKLQSIELQLLKQLDHAIGNAGFETIWSKSGACVGGFFFANQVNGA
jgi:hypothetical protein